METRKSIIDFMDMVCEVCKDREWWEGWQRCYDDGISYWGWGDIVSNVSEYKRRTELVVRYMRWLQEYSYSGMVPRWVTYKEVIGHARQC
jgi:hypothetical protein